MNKSESKYFNTATKMDLALISLLKKKPFEYITVSEICETAGVNRSTFYLHYETVGDLLDETARYLLNDFLSYFSTDTKSIALNLKNCELNDLIFICGGGHRSRGGRRLGGGDFGAFAWTGSTNRCHHPLCRIEGLRHPHPRCGERQL